MTIKFRPFQGVNYCGSSVRLLVVGHSHWGATPSSTLTMHTVEEWMNGEQDISYFTKLARVITGAEAGQIDRKAVFHNIAFYNFYQSVMPERSTQPTPEQFKAATLAFPLLLNHLDPTHVLATGITLWGDMPEFDESTAMRPVTLGRYTTSSGSYKTPSGHAFALGIPHMASYGFSPPLWSPLVKDFLAWR